MYEIACSHEEELRRVYENTVHVDYTSPSEEINELAEAGLIIYKTTLDEDITNSRATVSALGEEILEESFDNKRQFVEEMLEREKEFREQYSM